jgi:phosphatidylglycerophosphatase A
MVWRLISTSGGTITLANSPPSLRFFFDHPAHVIALGFGSGLTTFAPGTAGTLFAWLVFSLLGGYFGDLEMLLFLAFAYGIGIWAIDRTGRALGVVDHGSIVWDEIVPFWTVLWLTPHGFLWQAAAFALFRLFDITKPQPARWFDQSVKNGFGVMMDDVVAAFYTLLCLAGAKALLA